MSKESLALDAKAVAGMGMGAKSGEEMIMAPSWMANVECVRADGSKWNDAWKNAVQLQGKIELMNRFFMSGTNASQNVWYLGLHSATNATTNQMASMSAVQSAEVGGYAANRAALTITGTFTTVQYTTTASFGFTAAGPLTVSGMFVAGNMVGSTASATGGVAGFVYSAGNFGTPRTVLSNDTLNVSLTLNLA